ncbi:HEAT repeat domain-containing protein [Limnobacter sp.]|uniref:HEAT repeat domain-containing protein n=1 Tax=Limnobacter sp. TaxID=2003368 RepID=UPI0035196B33
MPFVKSNISAVQSNTEEESVATWLAQLDHPQASERRHAAIQLAKVSGASKALSARLWKESDASVREVIITAMVAQRDKVTLDTLIACLRTEDANLRNEAIEAIKNLPNEIGPHIDSLLADADADVRIFTVNILHTLPHPDTERWLCRLLHSDHNPNVCGAALDVLAEMGSTNCAPHIQAALTRFPDEPYLQFAGQLALKRVTQG